MDRLPGLSRPSQRRPANRSPPGMTRWTSSSCRRLWSPPRHTALPIAFTIRAIIIMRFSRVWQEHLTVIANAIVSTVLYETSYETVES